METDFQKYAYVNLGKFYRSLSDFGLKAIEFHQQTLRIAKEIVTDIQKKTHVVPLTMRITLSVISKEQSNFIGRLSV